MAKERLSMRKIKEILRLKWDYKLSNRQIGKSCSVAHSTVADYILRAKMAGLSWPLDPEMDDAAIENLLFPVTQNPLPIKIAKLAVLISIWICLFVFVPK